jgi:molybdenum cofactor cytidylyltransferase
MTTGSRTAFVAVVPAAGRATRFGGGKLVVDLEGRTMLDRTLDCLLDAGAAQVVVVAADPSELSAVLRLSDHRVRVVMNPQPDRGMFSSIQVGLAAIAADPQSPTLVLPGDMPFVRVETVAAVAEAGTRSAGPVAPTFDGRRGHPIALPSNVIAALCSAAPESSLKDALAAAGAHRAELPVDDPGILRDIDTRDDLRR